MIFAAELADMPFDQLQALRSKMGVKKFDAMQKGIVGKVWIQSVI